MHSGLDIAAAREAIRGVLPAGGASADTPVLVYWKDSLTVREGTALHRSRDCLTSHGVLMVAGAAQPLVQCWCSRHGRHV